MMDSKPTTREQGGVLPYFIVVLGAFFALAAILWLTRDEARPQGVGSARAAERAKNRVEVEAAQAEFEERRGADFNYAPLLGDRDPPLDYRR